MQSEGGEKDLHNGAQSSETIKAKEWQHLVLKGKKILNSEFCTDRKDLSKMRVR